MDNMSFPLISVVVPVYNIEQYIDQCIESIVKQTYINLEIIIVDDGSTDSSGEICEEWAARDARIKVIHKENGGLVSARKAGVLAAQGEYIGYVDGDDWIESDMYMQMCDRIVKYDVDIVAIENERDYSDGTSDPLLISLDREVYQGRDAVEELIANLIATDRFFQWNVPMTLWSYLFRRDILIHNQLKVDDRVRSFEDVICVLPCYMEARSVSYIHKRLYHYRQNEKSMKYTSRYTLNEEDAAAIESAVERLWSVLSMYSGNKEKLKKEIIYVVFYFLLMVGYEYCGRGCKDRLFPFDIPAGAKIALYGAGVVGQQIYDYITERSQNEIILWVDKRWEIYKKQNRNVERIEQLQREEYDYIVVAVLNASAQKKIEKTLIDMGIDADKIRICDPGFFSESYLRNILSVSLPEN